jgi:hypothetical protein
MPQVRSGGAITTLPAIGKETERFLRVIGVASLTGQLVTKKRDNDHRYKKD